MNIYVDIDDTICYLEEERNYASAKPIYSRIAKINKLYDEGNTITYWTARGTVSGIDFRPLTEEQFEKWSVKYHNLHFGKPPYDLFIDDKNMESKVFFND